MQPYSEYSESIQTPDLLHILLPYSLILKWNKYNCFLINVKTIPHNDKVKRFLDILAIVFISF
jgi:hypothetical protein